MRIEVLASLAQMDAEAWNTLVQDNNPFLRHEFLFALEQNGCVGEEFGWLPCHIAVYNTERTLVAAMPLYQKYNSYGEFVFDHAWAQAYERHKMRYFPKLVSAIPYTPASGQRFLVASGQEQALYPILLQAALQLAKELKASSFHCLFSWAEQQQFMAQQGLITRHDCQFHWHNLGYQSFDDFLEMLSAKKRKNIKQERRRVHDAGVALRVLDGHTATAADWAQFAFFYRHTFESKWGTPTMNEGFFAQVAKALPEQVILVLADKGVDCIAGSLMFRSDTRLFGRHWGCTEYVGLHFEACYYQGIEYCIQHGLQVFEPGAQGEHKVARGFIPTRTASSHWLSGPTFDNAIRQHCQLEQAGVAEYMREMSEHLPYRDGVLDARS